MKQYSRLLLISLVAILMILLVSACSEETNSTVVVNEEVELSCEAYETHEPYDTYNPEGIGGHFRDCYLHAGDFHNLDIFVTEDIVCSEEFFEWAEPLREMMRNSPDYPYGECLVNLVTFIEHFNISREVFQQLIDDTRVDFVTEYNLDILYSGDITLIEEFYRFENEMLFRQMAREREVSYFSAKIQELQQATLNQNSMMSRYYHDIWTYVSLMGGGYSEAYRWMQGLVDAGEYDRVNIVEFAEHLGLTREVFERWHTEFDMHLYTHYNIDIIFSGDPELIASYYSVENEHLHTALVLEAQANNSR